MKNMLIKLFVLPGGVALLISLSLLGLILLHLPHSYSSTQAKSEREEFPSQRRGGGTHWDITPDNVA
jgi:hypothetical protein